MTGRAQDAVTGRVVSELILAEQAGPDRGARRIDRFLMLRRAYFVDGNEKTAPSRTPADGQRCVMVFRFV